MPCAGSLYCIWLCKPRLHGFEFRYEFLQDGAWSLKYGLVTSGRYLRCGGDLRDAPYKSPRAKPKVIISASRRLGTCTNGLNEELGRYVGRNVVHVLWECPVYDTIRNIYFHGRIRQSVG